MYVQSYMLAHRSEGTRRLSAKHIDDHRENYRQCSPRPVWYQKGQTNEREWVCMRAKDCRTEVQFE